MFKQGSVRWIHLTNLTLAQFLSRCREINVVCFHCQGTSILVSKIFAYFMWMIGFQNPPCLFYDYSVTPYRRKGSSLASQHYLPSQGRHPVSESSSRPIVISCTPITSISVSTVWLDLRSNQYGSFSLLRVPSRVIAQISSQSCHLSCSSCRPLHEVGYSIKPLSEQSFRMISM